MWATPLPVSTDRSVYFADGSDTLVRMFPSLLSDGPPKGVTRTPHLSGRYVTVLVLREDVPQLLLPPPAAAEADEEATVCTPCVAAGRALRMDFIALVRSIASLMPKLNTPSFTVRRLRNALGNPFSFGVLVSVTLLAKDGQWTIAELSDVEDCSCVATLEALLRALPPTVAAPLPSLD